MPQRKIGRREFLKLAIAAAGAAGLSHFRILNIGGADVALAQEDDCTVPGNDVCDPSGAAGPPSPDTCPEGTAAGGTDSCDPANGDPDFCEPAVFVEDDDCYPLPLDADVCDTTEADDCIFGGPDTCELGPPQQLPDSCSPPANPDFCTPGVPNEDVCPDAPAGDGDICYPEAGEEDYCDPPGGPPPAPDTCEIDDPDQTPDTCEPGVDPDSPNPVTVDSVGVESASSILPSLGGVAAALGAAALWLRHRLRPKKSEEPETE